MKIALIRLRLIGDVVFTTPLVRALRRRHPDAHLTYIVEPLAAPVIRGNPHLDEIIEIPRRPGLGRWRDDLAWGRKRRRRQFDVAIDLHGGPRGAWLTWASGAPMRIGYQTPGRTWMYTHAVERPEGLLPRHSVRNQWDLLAPLGFDACEPTRAAVEMAADPAADASVSRKLQDAGIRADAPLVVVHVSAGNPFRRWPPESFVEAITELARRDPARRFILTSGPSDADAARAIADRVGERLGP